jgi:hypothetical protein
MVGMFAKGQFTLKALFIATTFIAAAAAVVRFATTPDNGWAV